MSFLSEFIELGLLYPCLQSTSESLFPSKSFNNFLIIAESLYHIKWVWLFIIFNEYKSIVEGLKSHGFI